MNEKNPGQQFNIRVTQMLHHSSMSIGLQHLIHLSTNVAIIPYAVSSIFKGCVERHWSLVYVPEAMSW